MISLKLCVLPGLFSLFFSIQTLNCQRQLQYSVGFTVYCRERKAPKLWDPGGSVSALQRQREKGISAGPYLPTTCGASLLIYSGHLSCNSPPTDRVYFTWELLKWKKGLPKPLHPLLLSSHRSELLSASSYVLEKPKGWVQDHLDFKFDSDLSPFTDICFNFNEANCTVQFGREPRKTGFWFSVHLNTRRSRNIILPANWSLTAYCC